MGKIIALATTDGSISQGLLGVNLAAALSAQVKGNIAVADLSFSGENEPEVVLNMPASKTILDLLPKLSSLDSGLIKGYLPAHASGVVVLGGAMAPGTAAGANSAPVRGPQIAQVLKALADAFPFVIVLSPPNIEERTEYIFEAADAVLAPVMPHLLSLKSTRKLTDALRQWHFSLAMAKPLLFLTGAAGSLQKNQVADFMKMQVFAEIHYEQDTIFSSINSGLPAVVASPHSAFSNDIKKLAKQLVDDAAYQGIDKSERARPGKAADPGEGISGTPDIGVPVRALKEKIHKALISELDLKNVDIKNQASVDAARARARTAIEKQLAKEGEDVLPRDARPGFIEELLNEVLGLGCLEELLSDPAVTEIMVNGKDQIYIEKQGKILLSKQSFSSDTQLRTVIDRIVAPIGRRVDESSPLVDARLTDGSRVNAVIPPISLIGPVVTIRKFSKKKLGVEDLIGFGALTQNMADFLRTCVLLRKNIVVSGGTGSGKTTLLNVVSSFIPSDERICTIEDSAELKLPQEHVVRLESRPASTEGTGEVSIRRLVINALRMRPDRIVVGECRGGETLDMLQAMNTGHDGSLTTIHSNSPKDGIARITTMVMMAGMDLPEKAIREQVAAAVHLIVQLSRMADGTRKVIEIAEVLGIRNGDVVLAPIFEYEQTGMKDGKVQGNFAATGTLPSFYNDIETHGLLLNKQIFTKGEVK